MLRITEVVALDCGAIPLRLDIYSSMAAGEVGAGGLTDTLRR